MTDHELRELILRGGVGDRAYVDGVIRMNRGRHDGLHAVLRARAEEAHAELRERIKGGLRGDELRAIFEAASERDHFVEEVLGIAYPPLDEATPGPEQIPYLPAGYDEIVHAFSSTKLRASDTFLDIGSGLGKVIMLAELLCGATASGVELDAVLHREATEALAALGLRSRSTRGDARTAPLPRADVVFMYLPFTGRVLETVLGRVLEHAPRYLCAGTLDLARHPRLHRIGAERSWLQVYAGGSSSPPSASPST